MSRIVVFGATSAIAAACIRRWSREGHDLFLIARDRTRLDALLRDLAADGTTGRITAGPAVDLDDLARHPGLLDEATAALGGLDVVLIAQGVLPDQKACEASVEETMAAIHTNALSVVSIATLAARRFEAARAGTIAVIGSVAGDRGRRSNYVYGAAKALVSTFLQGLRSRLTEAGVTVLTIKPGYVDTPMTAHVAKKGILWASPDDIARGIVAAVAARRDVVYLPGYWRWILFVARHVPEAVFKRLSF